VSADNTLQHIVSPRKERNAKLGGSPQDIWNQKVFFENWSMWSFWSIFWAARHEV